MRSYNASTRATQPRECDANLLISGLAANAGGGCRCDFAGRARDGYLSEGTERENARAGNLRELGYARDEGQQCDTAECDAVARGGQRLERRCVDPARFAEMFGKLGLCVSRHL